MTWIARRTELSRWRVFSPSSKIIGICTNENGSTCVGAYGRQCTLHGWYVCVFKKKKLENLNVLNNCCSRETPRSSNSLNKSLFDVYLIVCSGSRNNTWRSDPTLSYRLQLKSDEWNLLMGEFNRINHYGSVSFMRYVWPRFAQEMNRNALSWRGTVVPFNGKVWW